MRVMSLALRELLGLKSHRRHTRSHSPPGLRSSRCCTNASSFSLQHVKSPVNYCSKHDICTHTHIHPFNSPFSGTTRVSWYQKGKTDLDFTEARDSEWQWHQLGHMQVGTSLQADNHASTPPLSFLQAGFPSCRPTNSIKALKADLHTVSQ